MVHMTIGRRLTLWYGAFWTLSLMVLAFALYSTFAHNLLAEIDRALDEELAEIEMEVVNAKDAASRDAQLRKYFGRHPFYAIQVARLDGEVLFASDVLQHDKLPVPQIAADDQRPIDNLTLIGGRQYRAASRLAMSFDGPLVIQAADSLDLYHRELSQLVSVLLTLMPISIVVALAAGYWLSRRVLAPVDQLTTAAVRISAQRLSDRVQVPHNDDELSRLATSFNSMLDRLQHAFLQMQQFTADAAHELRTPLAVLRNEADVTLRSERTPDEYRRVLENQLEEVERMTRLADQLLFLCREDSGAPTSAPPISIGAFVSELVEDLQPLAEERSLELACATLPTCKVAIDPDRLRRLFCNLLDNALKYTPSGGAVSVSGNCQADSVEIVIADTGVGVAPDLVPRLFQRFYRVPSTRVNASGSGLGLAICQAIVERHGGQIKFESRPGSGTRVAITLPTTTAASL